MNKVEMIESLQAFKDKVSDLISELEDMRNDFTSEISQLEKDVEDQNVKGAKLDSDDFKSSSYLKSDDDMKIPKDDMKERAFYKGYYGKKT